MVNWIKSNRKFNQISPDTVNLLFSLHLEKFRMVRN